MSRVLRRVLREPFVHFLALGALLFALDSWRAPAEPAADPEAAEGQEATCDPARPTGPIVVTAGRREQLREGWQRTHGAPPSEDELASLVDAWIDQQVLFREGVARRLDVDDPGVQSRVAQKMGYVLESQVIVPEPSEAELRDYFAANAERWARDPRLDFTQVYVAGDDAAARARAGELQQRLAAGADPDGLGDTFSGGRRYRGRKIDALAQAFGDEFVTGLAEQAIDTWVVRRSRHGFHIVRVDRRSAGSAADFDAARLDVRAAWEEDLRRAGFEDGLARLRASWEIVREP